MDGVWRNPTLKQWRGHDPEMVAPEHGVAAIDDFGHEGPALAREVFEDGPVLARISNLLGRGVSVQLAGFGRHALLRGGVRRSDAETGFQRQSTDERGGFAVVHDHAGVHIG
jgi:hypothetical protein